MRTILLEDVYDIESLVADVVSVLKDGGVVLMPSDTCYGFVGDANNEEVRLKICNLKEMPEDKPISVAVGTMENLFELGEFDEFGRELVLQFLPGMLTVVVDSVDEGTIGLRYPDHKLMNMVSNSLGAPIFTTSANKHGSESPYGVEQVVDQLGSNFNNIDLVIDAGVLDANRPSTVVRILDHKIEIVREGDLAENLRIQYGV